MAGNEIEIPKEKRVGYAGSHVSSNTLWRVVRAKLANPLSSRQLLADTLDLNVATISEALATPWAQEQLAALADMGTAVHQKVEATIGDSLVFSHDAVRRGVKELAKSEPNPSAMTAARETANLMLKSTILPERLRITRELKTAADFEDMEPLPPELQAVLDGDGDDAEKCK